MKSMRFREGKRRAPRHSWSELGRGSAPGSDSTATAHRWGLSRHSLVPELPPTHPSPGATITYSDLLCDKGKHPVPLWARTR